MKQTVQERAKEMCEAWGMEDNHGYSVKDTFQVGFVQGANWQSEQSPWISVEESLPPNLHKNVLLKVENSGVFVGLGLNIKENDLKITHWMPIPEV